MASQAWQRELLTPENCVVAFVDHQPLMAFGVNSHDAETVRNNTVALAKAARTFDVPIVFTSINPDSGGDIWPELTGVAPDEGENEVVRTTMNAWEDDDFVAAVEATGRNKLVLSGLWTEVCVTFPALDALTAGYEVYVVTDTCGGTTTEAHEMAVDRMVQAGVVPVTWQQVMCELQRDWVRSETADQTLDIASQHSGAYGMGVDYVRAMTGGSEAQEPAPQ
ncbi:hydrolase [Haloarchaeobius amylolyticus]|uniref:hydrolase n=1 Tax=Haloarchaeobius amylolyticus TaxID=1198296 RepID=UPI0022711991|nr:hydrolase [Haloarchaeobius amylolyticus]